MDSRLRGNDKRGGNDGMGAGMMKKYIVIPAYAGISHLLNGIKRQRDSRVRGNDGYMARE